MPVRFSPEWLPRRSSPSTGCHGVSLAPFRGGAFVALLALALAAAPPVATAQDVTPASAKPAVKTRVITRVFIQSTGDASLRYADLLATEPPTLTPPQRVEGFPELDPARQSLVQMATASGKLMVGVRDDEDGEYQSGWVLIDCGVDEEEHGDHSHWYYNRKPSVLAKRLDDQQGNPAHLYCYDGVFYLANDRSGGFTRLDPAAIPAAAGEELIRAMAAFYPGGGGHITLAAAGKVVYATRMGRDDEGRKIDVTPISASGPAAIAYSISANSAGLHGATYESGKVFFAPSEGIDWLQVPESPQYEQPPTKLGHLDLGSHNETPNRTGSFANHAGHVLFVSGKESATFLGVIDARGATPSLGKVELSVAEGSRASGPKIIRPRGRAPLAVIFHDRPATTDAPDVATIVNLDRDLDGRFDDAVIERQIDVGASAVQGHGGHHDLATDASSRFVLVTNPGDASYQLFETENFASLASGELGFTPGHAVAVGGRGPIR